MKKDYFLSKEYLELLDKYFNASNYLSVAQLYLLDNPLLKDHELCLNDVKKKLVGHWGTVPGQNFIYTHCNRVIKKYDLNMILLSGPGHGGNFFVANSYLEGAYSEFYPEVSLDKKGMKKLCKQFSFPGGIGSHCVPETPGSINEGGELGYSLAHGFGAVFDNPNLIATVIVGDGEAETGPLATSWNGIKFLDPRRDGAVLPILHLNGYKINNPTILSRMSKKEVTNLFTGYGYNPIFVEGDDPKVMHKLMAKAMDQCIEQIKKVQEEAKKGKQTQYVWPLIVLRTPKGWTGPKVIEGKIIENSFRAHQIPLTIKNEEDLKQLKEWLLSYNPYELFDEDYQLKQEIFEILPKGEKRISANPHANGGAYLKPLKTPNLEKLAVKIKERGITQAQDMLVLGGYVKELLAKNKTNYRIFSPDEAMSNRLYKAFEVENRTFNAPIYETDEFLSADGRIMDSYLSEHMCEGWLEGYLLTGRHGMFNSYEAFIRVVDSMVAQHLKWIRTCEKISWRKPISSLNLIMTSNVWQQDHNGYTHQDPGFLDHLACKASENVGLYLPVDANSLLCCFDECSKSLNKVNVVVASKHPSYQWLSIQEAKELCDKGVQEWKWAGVNDTKNPDIVLASCGSTPNIESLATVSLIKQYLPELNVKFVNVTNLNKLYSPKYNSQGLSNAEFDKLFTKDKPVLFNFHGYSSLIYSLINERHNKNFIVSGYKEEGTITTSFDMRVLNEIDRYHLMLQVVKNVNISKEKAKELNKIFNKKLKEHYDYIREYGIDMPEILDWKWEN